MKRRQYRTLSTVGAVAIIAALASCTNPLQALREKLTTPASSARTEGSITVTINRVSPIVANLFKTASLPVLPASSRAYVAADRVHFELYSGPTLVLSWEANAGAFVSTGDSIDAPDKAVAEGSYTLYAGVYNSVTDPDNPVVEGTSVPFTVIAGQRTPVSVTCVPVEPNLVTLVKGTEVEVHPPYPWSGDQTGITVGTESWFAYAPTESDTNLQLTLRPLGPLGFNEVLALMAFDAEGNVISGPDPLMVAQATALPVGVPTDTTYIAIVDVAADFSGTGIGYTINNPGFAISVFESGPAAFRVESATTNSVTLVWENVPGATSYQLSRGASPDAAGSTVIHTGTETRVVDTQGVEAGQTYYYWVDATLSTSVTTDQSGAAAVTLPSTSPTPVTAVGTYFPDTIAPGEFKWYSLDVTPGTTYLVNWDDYSLGSGSYTARVRVSVYQQDQATPYVEDSMDMPFIAEAGGYQNSSSFYANGTRIDQPVDRTRLVTVPADSTDTKLYLLVREMEPGASSGTYRLRVGPNTNPVISSAYAQPSTVTLGESLDLFVNASDPEGRLLTYSWFISGWPNAPTMAEIHYASESHATFTPDASGIYTITVEVEDPYDGYVWSSFDITVNPNTTDDGGLGYGIN